MYECYFFPHAALDDSNKDDEPSKLDPQRPSSASDVSVDNDITSTESVAAAAPSIEVTVSESCVSAVDSTLGITAEDVEANAYTKTDTSCLDDASPNVSVREISLPRSRTPSPKSSPKRSPSRRVSEMKEGNLDHILIIVFCLKLYF